MLSRNPAVTANPAGFPIEDRQVVEFGRVEFGSIHKASLNKEVLPSDVDIRIPSGKLT